MSRVFNIVFFTFVGICLTSIFSIKARAADYVEPQIKLSTGFDYTSGDYGLTSDTDILYLPFSAEYKTLPWTFKATIPYVRITGPGGVVAGTDGGVIVGSGSNQRSTASGLGDIVLSASYALDTVLETDILIDLKAKAKLATADENKGLGTGENDYSMQLDLARVYGNITPFATVRYKVMGDPAGLDLNNTWLGSVGTDFKLSDKLNTGLSFDYKQASTELADDAKEAMAYANWKPQKHISVMAYGLVGFSDGSPDTGVGLQLSRRF